MFGRRKKSFFEKLTGSIRMDGELDEVEYEVHTEEEIEPEEEWVDEDEEGQLAVDMYQTSDEIVIKAMVAGVKQNDLDISISREVVTIRGERTDRNRADDEDYYNRELYWGTFSRTLQLPVEVEIEEADAFAEHGLLTIRLPKIDREKQARLKVRSL